MTISKMQRGIMKPVEKKPEQPVMIPGLYGKRTAAGCLVRMPNGKFCIVEPRGHFGDTWYTFPKGGSDPGESIANTARRETFEESGLQVALVKPVMKQKRTTSQTYYYLADAVGGSPQGFRRDETQSTRQVPFRALPFYLNKELDRHILRYILCDPELSQAFMPDAEVRDSSGLTGRDKLHRALKRASLFWNDAGKDTGPKPDPVHPESDYVSPTRLDEHVVLAPRGGKKRAVAAGTGKVDFVEAKSLSDVLPHIGARSVVLFDVDLTLMMPARNRFGGRMYGPRIPVEQTTVRRVKALQDSGVPVLGLTARHPRESEGVLYELRHVGIDLKRTDPLKKQIGNLYTSLNRGGVVFASDYNSKGEMLEQVYKATPFTHAVMVDDNVSNFYSLSVAAKKRGFDLTCAYYQPALVSRDLENQSDDWKYLKKNVNSRQAVAKFSSKAEEHRDYMLGRRGVFIAEPVQDPPMAANDNFSLEDTPSFINSWPSTSTQTLDRPGLGTVAKKFGQEFKNFFGRR